MGDQMNDPQVTPAPKSNKTNWLVIGGIVVVCAVVLGYHQCESKDSGSSKGNRSALQSNDDASSPAPVLNDGSGGKDGKYAVLSGKELEKLCADSSKKGAEDFFKDGTKDNEGVIAKFFDGLFAKYLFPAPAAPKGNKPLACKPATGDGELKKKIAAARADERKKVMAEVAKNPGKGADAKALAKARKEGAKEANDALEAERRARQEDANSNAELIKQKQSQIDLLLSNRATENQKAAMREQSCDDPNTSIIRVTTSTPDNLLVDMWYLTNDPIKDWIRPYDGDEGTKFIRPKCLDVSKPFYLSVMMQVDEDDPNFIMRDENDKCAYLSGSIHIWADNTTQNKELTEKQIVEITIGEDSYCAFKVQFNQRN